jgi:hypothetical protein
VTPKDKLHGRDKEIFEARDRKLEAAREASKKGVTKNLTKNRQL